MILNSPTISGSLTVTGNILTSGSITLSGSVASASFAATSSFVALAQSASNAVAAATASFANAFTVAGNLTAQTLVVQTITSSVDFVTGSTRFGSLLANTHVFSGSVTMNPGGLFVSSSGNVGIGTTPNTTAGITELAIGSSNTNPLISGIRDGVSAFALNSDAAGTLLNERRNLDLRFGSNNTERMRITNAGSVGLGTTSPSGKLHVFGNTYARYGTGDRFAFYYDDNYYFGMTNPSDDVRALKITAQAIDGVSTIQFFTGNNVERMRITSGGDLYLGNNSFTSPSSADRFMGIYGGQDCSLILQDAVQTWELYVNDDFYINRGSTNVLTALRSNGNVGIGTITPARKLDVFSDGVQFGDGGSFNFYMNSGPGAATGVTWTMNGTDRFRITAGGDINVLGGGSISTNGGAFRLRNSGQTASYGLFLTKAAWFGGGNTDYTPSIAAETGYGINTYTNGSASPAGPYVSPGGTTWTAGSSDVRKKKNFETTQGLTEILQIEPIKYHFNEDDDSSKKRLGFKAQNILPLIPEMVSETGEIAEDGSPYLTVTPDYILPVLVKAIQELKQQNDSLQQQINELKA